MSLPKQLYLKESGWECFHTVCTSRSKSISSQLFTGVFSTSTHGTCGTLLELLVFLFPPLPGLEEAPQGGQFAVSADGWRVDPAHQATRP